MRSRVSGSFAQGLRSARKSGSSDLNSPTVAAILLANSIVDAWSAAFTGFFPSTLAMHRLGCGVVSLFYCSDRIMLAKVVTVEGMMSQLIEFLVNASGLRWMVCVG